MNGKVCLFIFTFEELLKGAERRTNSRLFALPTAELWGALDRVLFLGASAEEERIANEEQRARHVFTPESQAFVDWKIFLVDDGRQERMLWKQSGDQEPWEVRLRAGEADEVLAAAVSKLKGIHDREAATSKILDALNELADREVQAKRWWSFGGKGSSFEEAVSRLFDESGLGPALERGEVVFTAEADAFLRRLEATARAVAAAEGHVDMLGNPAMAAVRRLAAEALSWVRSALPDRSWDMTERESEHVQKLHRQLRGHTLVLDFRFRTEVETGVCTLSIYLAEDWTRGASALRVEFAGVRASASATLAAVSLKFRTCASKTSVPGSGTASTIVSPSKKMTAFRSCVGRYTSCTDTPSAKISRPTRCRHCLGKRNGGRMIAAAAPAAAQGQANGGRRRRITPSA